MKKMQPDMSQAMKINHFISIQQKQHIAIIWEHQFNNKTDPEIHPSCHFTEICPARVTGIWQT